MTSRTIRRKTRLAVVSRFQRNARSLSGKSAPRSSAVSDRPSPSTRARTHRSKISQTSDLPEVSQCVRIFWSVMLSTVSA